MSNVKPDTERKSSSDGGSGNQTTGESTGTALSGPAQRQQPQQQQQQPGGPLQNIGRTNQYFPFQQQLPVQYPSSYLPPPGRIGGQGVYLMLPNMYYQGQGATSTDAAGSDKVKPQRAPQTGSNESADQKQAKDDEAGSADVQQYPSFNPYYNLNPTQAAALGYGAQLLPLQPNHGGAQGQPAAQSTTAPQQSVQGLSQYSIQQQQQQQQQHHQHQHQHQPQPQQTTQHTEKTNTRPSQPDKDPDETKPFKCSHCSWAFARHSDLRRHLRSHAVPEYRCPYWTPDYLTCPRSNRGLFARLDVLKRHLRLVHYDVDVAENGDHDSSGFGESGRCLACDRFFPDSKHFIDHVEECAKTTPVKNWRFKKNGMVTEIRKDIRIPEGNYLPRQDLSDVTAQTSRKRAASSEYNESEAKRSAPAAGD